MSIHRPSSSEILEYRSRAEIGDPDALISLAWEYFLGGTVDRDLEESMRLLKRAEEKKPRLARFYAAKIRILEGQAGSYEDLYVDCDGGYGPACYLMSVAAGKNLTSTHNKNEEKKFLSLAAQQGHLVSKFFLWKDSGNGMLKRIALTPYSINLLVKIIIARYKDPQGPNVLT